MGQGERGGVEGEGRVRAERGNGDCMRGCGTCEVTWVDSCCGAVEGASDDGRGIQMRTQMRIQVRIQIWVGIQGKSSKEVPGATKFLEVSSISLPKAEQLQA